MTLRTWGSTTRVYLCIFVMMLFLNQTTTSSDLVFFVFEFQDVTDFVIRDTKRRVTWWKIWSSQNWVQKNTENCIVVTQTLCTLYSYITPNKPRLQHNYMYIFTTNRVINTYVLKCEQTRKIFFLFL